MGKIKPGYYWAYDPNREHDIIVRVSDSGVASDMIVQNTDACSDAEIKQRIPSAKALSVLQKGASRHTTETEAKARLATLALKLNEILSTVTSLSEHQREVDDQCIPTAEELAGWKTDIELQCTACGSRSFVWDSLCNDSRVVWHCRACGKEQVTEARYRVVKP